MKKIIYSIIIVCVFNTMALSNEISQFEIDNNYIEIQLKEASKLEAFVLQNNSISLSQLQEDKAIIEQFSLNNFTKKLDDFTLNNFNIEACLWGFCCWPVGMFTVILKDNCTRSNKLSYIIGVSSLSVLYLGVLFYAFLVVFGSGS
jgi:hypothetical protein